MNLLDACNEYLIKGQQGQLVIKFVNDVHLCKILVADGEAVHISHGRLAPETILQELPARIVEWVNFIAGYPVRKRVDLPLHEQLLKTAKGQQGQPAAPPVAKPTTTKIETIQPAPAAPTGPTVPAEKVIAAVNGFIDHVGPIGTILAENASAALNCTSGDAMAQSNYVKFVIALGKEVPETARDVYLAQFSLNNP